MRRLFRALMLLAALPTLLLAVATQASAQYSDSLGGSFNNPISAGLSSQIWGNLQIQQNLNLQRMLMRNSTARRRPPASTEGQATTTFTPVSPALMPRQLAALLGRTPAERRQLEQLLTLCLQVYRQFEPKIRPAEAQSAPTTDVARAVAYYIVSNYYVYSQGQQASPPQYEQLYGKIRDYLLSNDQFRRAGDEQKQQIQETLAILASLPLLGYTDGVQKRNQEQQEAARQLAAQNLARVGIAAERIALTDGGLIIR